LDPAVDAHSRRPSAGRTSPPGTHIDQPGDPRGEQQEQPGIGASHQHGVPVLAEEDDGVPQNMDNDQRQHAARAQEQPDEDGRPYGDPEDAQAVIVVVGAPQ